MTRILSVSSYPVEAAATRFRVEQYIKPLSERGFRVDLRPFLTGEQFREFYRGAGLASKIVGMLEPLLRRVTQVMPSTKYDLLFVQREAMPFGPAIFEWLYQAVGRLPMVLDLDDATYVRYVSPTYGRLGSALKSFGKTDKLIDQSAVVICGNSYIAEHVESRGRKAVVIPTVVDTQIFHPIVRTNDVPVIGWIGTHSTFQFLKTLFPVLRQLAMKHKFRLKVVGSGVNDVSIDGVDAEVLPWSLDREVEDFQSLDIGLYPLDTKSSLDPAWLAGKSGFKAIQYLAVGVPFVMSPVGVCAEIGEHGKTHFNAACEEDWYNSLDKLLLASELRLTMGAAGRLHSIATYNLETQASLLADTLESIGKARQC